MSSLEGKCAIVSGAAQGLGTAFAAALAAEGARVIAFDIQDTMPAIAEAIEGDVTGLIADVADRADVERVIAEATSRYGGVDILVNNAAAWKPTLVEDPWEQAVADWDEIMGPNLRGLLMISRACVPEMRKRGGGEIVNISTYYVLPARSPGTNNVDTDLYNASKWALNGFTDAWAKYLAEDNIRVNGLCMGATDSPMLRGLFADGELPEGLAEAVLQPEQIAAQLIDLIADGRSGENIGAWVGHPVELGPRKPAHKRITG